MSIFCIKILCFCFSFIFLPPATCQLSSGRIICSIMWLCNFCCPPQVHESSSMMSTLYIFFCLFPIFAIVNRFCWGFFFLFGFCWCTFYIVHSTDYYRAYVIELSHIEMYNLPHCTDCSTISMWLHSKLCHSIK